MQTTNKQIRFENADQIINMGGPWVGSLFFNDTFVSNNVLIDNLVYKPLYGKLFFIKYHNVSKWQNENYFTIDFLDLSNSIIYEFEKKFDKLFLGEFISEYELKIYDAFHDGENVRFSIFDLKKEKNELL